MTARLYRNLPPGCSTDDALGLDVERLQLPTLAVRERALRNNLELMQRWCAEYGVSHAPHGKTHMSPELTAMQIAHGAWAMSAATVGQAAVFRAAGVRRVLIANQVVDQAGLRWLSATRDDPQFEVLSLVDSVECVQRIDDAFAGEPGNGSSRHGVLVELGLAGKRAGVRSLDAAVEVGRAVTSSRSLQLLGVECFEGVIGAGRHPDVIADVDAFVRQTCELALELDGEGLFGASPEIVISSGGSCFFDRLPVVVGEIPALAGLSRPVRLVVRPGGYIVHDRDPLALASPLDELARHPLGALQPALELWAAVQSIPEPGLAIAAFGKRDASFDITLPVPIGLRSQGARSPVPAGLRVDRVNDQHAYLLGEGGLRVGDVIRFGVTHGCTSFDKWPLIPVIDDDDRIVDFVTTRF